MSLGGATGATGGEEKEKENENEKKKEKEKEAASVVSLGGAAGATGGEEKRLAAAPGAAAGGSGPPVLKALLEVAPDLYGHTLAAKANNTGRAQAK